MGGEIRARELTKARRVGFIKPNDFAARISALEGRMQAVEDHCISTAETVRQAADNAAQAVANTAELLGLMQAAKGTLGFVKKHGPRFVSFGVGIFTAAGIGNPKVLQFISTFFG